MAENGEVHIGFIVEETDGTTKLDCYGVAGARDSERSVSSSALLSSDRELCIAGGDGDCGIEGCADTSPHLHVHVRSPLCETEGCDAQAETIVPLTLLGSGLCTLGSPTAAIKEPTTGSGGDCGTIGNCESKSTPHAAATSAQGNCCADDDCKSSVAAALVVPTTTIKTAPRSQDEDDCCKDGPCKDRTTDRDRDSDRSRAESIVSASELIRKAGPHEVGGGYVLACPDSRCRRRFRCAKRRILQRLNTPMTHRWVIFGADGLPAGIGVDESVVAAVEGMERRRTAPLKIAMPKGEGRMESRRGTALAKTEIICDGICCAAEIPIVHKTLDG